jgi:aminoglycoside 6'-N-acetyltransferase
LSRIEPISDGRYSFRLVETQDLLLLRQWLGTPEVLRWWGDAAEEEELLRQDIDDPRMTMHIVAFEGRSFAYVQDYDVRSWPQPHFTALPAGTRAVDSFIGEPGMIGQGHGSAYLKFLARRLMDGGTSAVAIDPDLDNVRAQRAYRKAGFRDVGIIATEAGPVVLMLFTG